ncbi:MAG: hypothetical protein AAGI34_04610 [Pseudomonadota bacterium]
MSLVRTALFAGVSLTVLGLAGTVGVFDAVAEVTSGETALPETVKNVRVATAAAVATLAGLLLLKINGDRRAARNATRNHTTPAHYMPPEPDLDDPILPVARHDGLHGQEIDPNALDRIDDIRRLKAFAAEHEMELLELWRASIIRTRDGALDLGEWRYLANTFLNRRGFATRVATRAEQIVLLTAEVEACEQLAHERTRRSVRRAAGLSLARAERQEPPSRRPVRLHAAKAHEAAQPEALAQEFAVGTPHRLVEARRRPMPLERRDMIPTGHLRGVH